MRSAIEFCRLLLFLNIITPTLCRPFDFGFGSPSYPTYFFGGVIPKQVPETYRPATAVPASTSRPTTSASTAVTSLTSRPTNAISTAVPVSSSRITNTASTTIVAFTNRLNAINNKFRQIEDSLGLPTPLEDQAENLMETVQGVVHDVAAEANNEANVVLTDVGKEATSFYNATAVAAVQLTTEIRDQAGLLKTEIANAAKEGSQKLKGTVDKVESQASELWNTTAEDVSKGYAATTNFFTSTWASCRNWWYELEEEVRDFWHFLIKVIEVTIGLILLFIALWALKQIRHAYSFVKRHTTLPEDIPMSHM